LLLEYINKLVKSSFYEVYKMFVSSFEVLVLTHFEDSAKQLIQLVSAFNL
jgi:hypothetical protein